MRPTTGRVREAIGNRLSSLGVLRDARVVDLFAGTGALGIEALSRGGAHSTFVENAPAALRTIEVNVETLGFAPQSTVVRGDAVSFVAGAPEYDIAFIDPPYTWDAWDALLSSLRAEYAVCEARNAVAVPAGWELLRSDRYGTTVVTLIRAST
ncbi:MAG: rRNA (guanine966-N2)-methyltransferase [Actinomycetota bacterium]